MKSGNLFTLELSVQLRQRPKFSSSGKNISNKSIGIILQYDEKSCDSLVLIDNKVGFLYKTCFKVIENGEA